MNSQQMKKVKTFLKWAYESLSDLDRLDPTTVSELISTELLKVNKQLGVEVLVAQEKEVIITAFSDPQLFPIVFTIVEGLSNVEGWRFIPLKPPRGFSFKISLGMQELDASKLRYRLIPEIDNGIQLLIPSYIYERLPNEEAEELAWLIIETGLGERLTGTLNHIEFAIEDNQKNSYDIDKLKDNL